MHSSDKPYIYTYYKKTKEILKNKLPNDIIFLKLLVDGEINGITF